MPSHEADWSAWMRAARDGDAVAYRRFLAATAPHIRAMARARCRSLGAPEVEAEDVVQDVLLAIHLKRGSWDETQPIGPWIAAIVRHKLIDILRRRGHRVSVPIEDVMDSLPAPDPGPNLAARDLDVVLASLKARQREIVRAISIDGDSVGETAHRLRMTEGAVRVALHRALKGLALLYRSPTRAD